MTEYVWDHRNRLTRVTEKDEFGTTTQVVAYTYDVFNRRIAKAVDTTSPFNLADAAIERYIYDDRNGVASIDGGNVILDFVDPDGEGATEIELVRRHLYGHAVDQLLAQENVEETISDPERVLWPLVDHLATVRDLIDNGGTLVEHYEYDSFGQILSGNTSLTRYLYTSREHDSATGLQYNRARWYDSAVGRWISEDPIGFDAGDANLRRYVGNSSTFVVDPSGLEEYGRINRETDNAWIYRVSKFDPGYAAVLRQGLIHQEEERTRELYHIKQWEVMAERNANKAMSHVLASSANAASYAVDRTLFAIDTVTNAPFLLTGTTPDDVTDVWLISRYGQTGSIMVTSPDEFGAEAHDTRLITNWLVQESANPLNWFAVGSATYLDDIARYGQFADESTHLTEFWKQTVRSTSKAPKGTMNTFSSGAGRYIGGPQLSIDDAYRLGREHGIDMRQFKLDYAPGNEYDFGSVGRYFNPRTLEPGDIVRAADGRIELRLFDKGLRSPQDLIETLSHELNHVREFYKTGVFSAESAAEAAAEAARPFIRPR